MKIRIINMKGLFASSVLIALTACNGPDQALQKIDGDWIDQTNIKASPTPTTSSTPEPNPGPSPSPSISATPTPTPTSSPGPSPSSSPSPSPSPSSSPSPTPTPSVTGRLYKGPDEVEKYVLKFVDDAKAQGVNVLPKMTGPQLEIRIASLDQYGSGVIGLCETGTNLRRVTFDPDFWNVVSETQKEILAHHELGHCILYRAHRTDILSSGAYASIMYPIIMSSSTYNNNYSYYQQELFTWKSSNLTENLLDSSGSEAPEKVTTHICGDEHI